VFLDVTSLKGGDFWKAEIIRAINDAPVFVVCCCCESQRSTFVAEEIWYALKQGEKRLVPVLFCDMPLPDYLAQRQWIDLRGRITHVCNDHVLVGKDASFERSQITDLGGSAAFPYRIRRQDHPARRWAAAVVVIFGLTAIAAFRLGLSPVIKGIGLALIATIALALGFSILTFSLGYLLTLIRRLRAKLIERTVRSYFQHLVTSASGRT
jgi:hypothetical protein